MAGTNKPAPQITIEFGKGWEQEWSVPYTTAWMQHYGEDLQVEQVGLRLSGDDETGGGVDEETRRLAEHLKGHGQNVQYSHFPTFVPHVQGILLTLSTSAAGYFVKKVVEVLVDDLNKKLLETKKCKHRHATLYGPDGEVVSVVECDLKPDGHALRDSEDSKGRPAK